MKVAEDLFDTIIPDGKDEKDLSNSELTVKKLSRLPSGCGTLFFQGWLLSNLFSVGYQNPVPGLVFDEPLRGLSQPLSMVELAVS